MHPGLINEMHVVDTRGASGHAGQARQAAIDMLDRFLRCGLVLFQHVFDQVNAAPGAVELIAQKHVSRAGSRAEPAMYAGSQYLVGLRRVRVLQLFCAEICLHGSDIFIHAAAIKDTVGIK